MDPYIGEIRLVAFTFAPQGWADCNGQLLPINQNQALFALLGTTYGGNGQTTFALPNLQGRLPMHAGSGPGLTPRTQGEAAGTESHTLLTSQMPQHTHTGTLLSSTSEGDRTDPANAYPARPEEPLQPYAGTAGGTMAAGGVQVGPAGSSLPVGHMPPYLTLRFVIALQGIFPARP